MKGFYIRTITVAFLSFFLVAPSYGDAKYLSGVYKGDVAMIAIKKLDGVQYIERRGKKSKPGALLVREKFRREGRIGRE